MKALGAPQEAIDKALGITSSSEDDQPEDQSFEVEVWYTHSEAVKVFQHAQPQHVAGMSGMAQLCVTSSEIESVCRNLGIKRKKRIHILEDVQFMSCYAASLINRQSGNKNERVPDHISARR